MYRITKQQQFTESKKRTRLCAITGQPCGCRPVVRLFIKAEHKSERRVWISEGGIAWLSLHGLTIWHLGQSNLGRLYNKQRLILG